LSGGLDSSFVAAYAAQNSKKKISAYTVFWGDGEKSSELQNAKRIADFYKLEHFSVEVDADRWFKGFNDATHYRDSPFGETADIPVFLLAEVASRKVKVVLSGEGADELFLGYQKYKLELLARRKFFRILVRVFYPYLVSLLPTKFERALGNMQVDNHALRQRGYFKTLWPKGIEFQLVSKLQNHHEDLLDERDHLGKVDLNGWLPYLLLDRADRMCMAWGIESRPPYLGQDLIDSISKVSDIQKLASFRTKPLLRNISRKWLKKEFTNTPKRGFPMPIAEWFRKDLSTELVAILSRKNAYLDSVISINERLEIMNTHVENKKDYSAAIFTMISWITWHEFWVDRMSGGNS